LGDEKITTESDGNTNTPLSEYYKIDKTFYQESNYEKAIEWFDKALEIEPYAVDVAWQRSYIGCA
jgi:tetratricopeptide (TPR) repeat protein